MSIDWKLLRDHDNTLREGLTQVECGKNSRFVGASEEAATQESRRAWDWHTQFRMSCKGKGKSLEGKMIL